MIRIKAVAHKYEIVCTEYTSTDKSLSHKDNDLDQIDGLSLEQNALRYADAVADSVDGFVNSQLEKKPSSVKSSSKSHDCDANGLVLARDLERSVRRTKQTIRDYARNNTFQYFATLTFNPWKYKSFNLLETNKLLKLFLRQITKNGAKYLVVAEFHKDKKKIHYHALIQGPMALKTNKNGFPSIISWKYGFSSIKNIKQDEESTLKISSYITKYITKALMTDFGSQRYYVSKGLTKPITLFDRPANGQTIKDPDFQNEFCKIKTIKRKY